MDRKKIYSLTFYVIFSDPIRSHVDLPGIRLGKIIFTAFSLYSSFLPCQFRHVSSRVSIRTPVWTQILAKRNIFIKRLHYFNSGRCFIYFINKTTFKRWNKTILYSSFSVANLDIFYTFIYWRCFSFKIINFVYFIVYGCGIILCVSFMGQYFFVVANYNINFLYLISWHWLIPSCGNRLIRIKDCFYRLFTCVRIYVAW